jgi:hypothetical protein
MLYRHGWERRRILDPATLCRRDLSGGADA